MSVREDIRSRLRRLRHAKPSEQDRRRLDQLEQRLAHVEALVEGLQDSIHRDSVRHEQRMLDLERKTEPETLAKALSDDARRRGL
jgi:hypothetical protein